MLAVPIGIHSCDVEPCCFRVARLASQAGRAPREVGLASRARSTVWNYGNGCGTQSGTVAAMRAALLEAIKRASRG